MKAAIGLLFSAVAATPARSLVRAMALVALVALSGVATAGCWLGEGDDPEPTPGGPSATTTNTSEPGITTTNLGTIPALPLSPSAPGSLPVGTGQAGGATRAVSVRGSLLLAGAGPRVVLFDVANPSSLRVLAESPPLAGVVESVVLDETNAYAVAGSLLVMLGTSGSSIRVLDTAALDGQPTVVRVARGLLYVGGTSADGTGFIAVFDASDGTLVRAGAVAITDAVGGLAVVDDSLVTDTGLVFDLSGPVDPVPIPVDDRGVLMTPPTAPAVLTRRGLIVLAQQGAQRFELKTDSGETVDLRDHASAIARSGGLAMVHVQCDVGVCRGGLVFLHAAGLGDVPIASTLDGGLALLGDGLIAAAGGTPGDPSLSVFSSDAQGNVALVASTSTPSRSVSLDWYDNESLVSVDGMRTLAVVRPTTNALTVTQQVELDLQLPRSGLAAVIALDDGIAVAAGPDGIYHGTTVDSLDRMAGTPSSWLEHRTPVILSANPEGGATVLDPGLRALAMIAGESVPAALAPAGEFAFISNGARLTVYSLTDPANPVALVSGLFPASVSAAALLGEQVVVATRACEGGTLCPPRLTLLEFDGGKLVEVAAAELPGEATAIASSNGRIFVGLASGNQDLQGVGILTLTAATGFSVVEIIPLASAPLDFAPGETVLAVAAGEAGIYTLPLP